jgi:hypothetical protein
MAQPNPQEWLSAWAKLQKLADRDVQRILEESRIAIQADISRLLSLGTKAGVGSTVRLYQFQQIRLSMLREEARVFRRLKDVTKARMLEAAAASVELSQQSVEDLFLRAGRPDLAAQLGQALNVGLEGTLEVALTRMEQSRIPLAQRIYNTQAWMDGRVERGINSALTRGLSAREFAKEALDWFSPTTPGGARYAAMRLARTEINNAFHAMAVNAADAPWTKGMKWHLSQSHPKPDICDEYARNDPDNLGEGVYKVRNVPKKPHPHCFCFVTPVVEEEDAFLDNLVAGRYDSHIDGVLAGSGRSIPAPRKVAPGRPVAPPKKVTKAAVPKKTTQPAQKLSVGTKPKKPAKTALEKFAEKGLTHDQKVARLLASEMSENARPATERVLNLMGEHAPRSLGDLKRVHNTNDHEWQQHGEGANGFYWSSGPNAGELHMSPAAGGEAFEAGKLSAMDVNWSVRTFTHDGHELPGLRSTMAHEFGHHIEATINKGTGAFPSSIGQALSEALGEAVGVRGPHLSGGALYREDLSLWMTTFKSKIERSLSQYGASQPSEMFAEIWAAYTGGTGHLQERWSKVGKILEKAAEKAAAER